MPLRRASWVLVTFSVLSLSTINLGCGGGTAPSTPPPSGSGTPPPPPAKTLLSISTAPSAATLVVGGTEQLAVTATYSDDSTADVTSSATWATSNATAAGVSDGGMVTAAASGNATVTAAYNGLNATSAVNVTADVLTWHGDNARSGLNAGEGILTPQNVKTPGFGKLFSYLVDGYIYAQPLLVSNLTVNGGAHDVVFVATENDSVYAFDADQAGSGSPLWQVSLLQAGETPITNGSIQPNLGITSTPAIDLSSQTLYVLSTQWTGGAAGTFRLHALDLATGAEKFGGPVVIQASVPGTNSEAVNGVVTLTTSCLQRSALLVANGEVFAGFGSCHSGWLVAYDAQKLTPVGVFNMSPNMNGVGKYGGAGGVWMGGGGPAADSSGNVYVSTGNGPYDGLSSFGDSILKFDPQLHLLDHFTPTDSAFMNCKDSDLAAGGLLLIPGTTQAVAGGKSGKLYMVNTSNLGGSQVNDAGATQTLWFEPDISPPYASSCTDVDGTFTTDINSYEIFGTGAFFNGSMYLGVTPTLPNIPGSLRQFAYSGGLLNAEASSSASIALGSYGTTPFVSAAGTSNGVVWMLDHGNPVQSSAGTTSAAILRAYPAGDLSQELYDSAQNSADTPGLGIKFTAPIVANGKVYVGTAHDPIGTANPQGELDVYGLKN